jgi:hypothetical protein
MKIAPRSMEQEIVAEPLDVKKGGGSSKLFTIVFVAVLAIALNVLHVKLSSPVKVGHTVGPGTWLSKCGVLIVHPTCENEYLSIDKNGTMLHYNAARELTWRVDGGTCDSEDKDCISGLHFQADRKVFIGGKKVKYVMSYTGKDQKLTPWPFEEKPDVNVYPV